MSPRIKNLRKVVNPPKMKGFKPFGLDNVDSSEPILLMYEEYEALRLCDHDMFTHAQAARLMCISRPTFTRIYASVRKKLAIAFVEGREIVFETGKVYFDSDWFYCKKCSSYFNNPEKEKNIQSCPLCANDEVEIFDHSLIENCTEADIDICYCIKCQYEKPHQFGSPCNKNICPKCNIPLRRKEH